MGFDPGTIILSLYLKCWCDHALVISSVFLFNVDLDIRVLLTVMSARHLKYQANKNIFRLWWCIMICKATAAAETWQSQSTVWAQLAATQACWHILTIIFIIIIALFPFDRKYDTYHCFILFLNILISTRNWQLHIAQASWHIKEYYFRYYRYYYFSIFLFILRVITDTLWYKDRNKDEDWGRQNL